ncbi:uncharacterized protein [Mytilus edulis]|uniref:uncharacterized protein n=1 Tax=Mytilus edulis TaxID=6550 RepID=UPI0039F034A0
MRDEKIAVLDKRVVNLQNDLLKERNASQMFIADISVRMQDWLVKSKEMTTEIEKEAYGNFDSENGMNQHRINAEELREGFKNLHTNKDNDMGQIETKDSEDKEEPIDQWLRNKDTKLLKVAAKVETDLQLQQLNTDVAQGGEKVTVITKHDAGDTDEGSNVSEETTEAEIGDEKQVTVHLMNAENTCIWNSNKSSAEELKEGFKNLRTNKDNNMGQIETKDSEDKEEPIDQWLRNKDTKLLKVAAKVETDLQLQQLNTEVSQGGEKETVITKNDAGDTDEGLNVSEETTEAEILDEKQVTVHLMNAENTCVRNSNNSYKDNHLEFNQSVDIVDSDAVEVETSGELCDDLQIPYRKESEAKHCENEEDQNLFKGVDKDKNNIQLQKLNMDEVKGNGGGTGRSNSDEGDTDEVFYSDETATKGIGDDKEEIAPLRKTGKDYMRNTACRPLSDDFGALPIKERIKLMEKQRFLKKYKSE